MFNYNAREMYSGSGSYLIPKTQGQLYDDDITLNSAGVTAHTEEGWAHITTYQPINFGSAAANPFNRNTSNSSFTFIYKTHNFNSGNLNLFANRKGSYNYMVRATMFHTSQSGFLSLTPNSNPQIGLIRIYSDGKSERKFLDADGNVLQSVSSSTISWGNQNDAIAFFAGSAVGGELFNADFYWMYCSLETLTDAEVLQVIQYNENSGPTFEVDTTAITATYSATTSSVTLTADEDMAWTASTLNGWITVSPVSGTGSATITISLAKNTVYTQRAGTVTLTNGEDTIEIECTQEKHPLLVPKNNIYREGNLIN